MIEYIREMNKNYIKISTENDMQKVSYCMKMIENNDIAGLLGARRVDLNGKSAWLYEISGMISLEEKYEGKYFSASDLEYIADFFKDIIDTGKKYMLDMDGLMISPKYIFCGIGNGEWHLIYNITSESSFRDGLKKLFEFVLERLDHKESSAVVVGYALYKRVCQEDITCEEVFDYIKSKVSFDNPTETLDYEVTHREYPMVCPEEIIEQKEVNLGLFKKIFFVAGLVGAIGAAIILFTGIIPGIRDGDSVGKIFMDILVLFIFAGLAVLCIWIAVWKKEYFYAITASVKQINYSVDKAEINSVPHAEAGELDDRSGTATMLLSGLGCTKLIMRGKGNKPDREYVLEDMPATIGSVQADIIVNEPGISRIHARISREGELLFIKDMNSTNGTWVNEHQLTVYELCRINNGDIIKLADTSFELIDTLFQ